MGNGDDHQVMETGTLITEEIGKRLFRFREQIGREVRQAAGPVHRVRIIVPGHERAPAR
jgi:hypothetical protein